MGKKIIRIATRKSPLALWQAQFVGNKLKEQWPDLDYTLIPLVTSGDKFLKDKLQAFGGKGLFVKELEEAIIANKADIAVHSMKDMPSELPNGLTIASLCKRDNPKDAFVSVHYKSVHDLPLHSHIGTISLRRQSQLLALRSDLNISPLRGNIQTRLSRLEQGDFDAIILAAAGLERMGYQERITEIFSTEDMLPACAQGALGIECRTHDKELLELLAPLNDEVTAICVQAERQVNALLGGNCHVPVGIYCCPDNLGLKLRAKVLSLDGQVVIETIRSSSFEDIFYSAKLCAQDLLNQGAGALIEQ